MLTRSADFFHSTVRSTVDEFLNESWEIPNDGEGVRRARLAAIVLYHMADYWYLEHCTGNDCLSKLHEELIRDCSAFKTIRDIADASKHAELNRPGRIKRELSSFQQVAIPPVVLPDNFSVPDYMEATRVIATMDDGTDKDVRSEVWDVLEMWERKLKQA